MKRREFLTRTSALGGMTLLGTAAVPAALGGTTLLGTAAVPAAAGGRTSARSYMSVGNAIADDFAELVGESFRLRSEDGSSVRAQLVEVNVPRTRRALRFRREHFSLVFDVPRTLARVQGNYALNHPRLGSLELFMVPVDLARKHNRLEAVFT